MTTELDALHAAIEDARSTPEWGAGPPLPLPSLWSAVRECSSAGGPDGRDELVISVPQTALHWPARCAARFTGALFGVELWPGYGMSKVGITGSESAAKGTAAMHRLLLEGLAAGMPDVDYMRLEPDERNAIVDERLMWLALLADDAGVPIPPQIPRDIPPAALMSSLNDWL